MQPLRVTLSVHSYWAIVPRLLSLLGVMNNRTYVVVGFGETPGTLWVWASGLPKNSSFRLATAAESRSQPENKGFWRAYSPPSLPKECDRVSPVKADYHFPNPTVRG
jgi:hypothetical protein